MLKKSFIEAQVDNGGRKDVVKFIADVRYYFGYAEQDVLRRFFRKGYCYYFAVILKTAFGDGEVVCLPDKGHFVYRLDGVMYDIEGVYENEDGLKIVSEDELGDEIFEYLHRDLGETYVEDEDKPSADTV